MSVGEQTLDSKNEWQHRDFWPRVPEVFQERNIPWILQFFAVTSRFDSLWKQAQNLCIAA